MNPLKNLILRPALVLFAVLSVITGLLYPLAITGVSQMLFPEAANGSLVVQDGRVVGSRLIGQPFTRPDHFWGRPSATAPEPYNASASGGSNLGPRNPAQIDAVQARVQALREADPQQTAPIPVDLVTASGSGLDPHISRAAADFQVPRVVRATGLPVTTVVSLVEAHTEGRWLGLLGEPRVNVLLLNQALDAARRPAVPMASAVR